MDTGISRSSSCHVPDGDDHICTQEIEAKSYIEAVPATATECWACRQIRLATSAASVAFSNVINPNPNMLWLRSDDAGPPRFSGTYMASPEIANHGRARQEDLL